MTDTPVQASTSSVDRPVRQLAITVLSQILSWLFAMVVMFVLPKYRTIPDFAIFSVMFGYISLVNSIGDNGISSLISRTVSINPERTWGLVRAAATIKILVSIASALVFAGLFKVIHYNDVTAKFVVYGILCSTSNQIGSIFKDAIRGFGKVSTSSILQLIERGISTFLTVMLAVTNQPLHMFVWVPVLFDIALGCVSLTRLSKLVPAEKAVAHDFHSEIKFLFSQFLILSSGFVIIQAKDPLSLTLMEYWGSPDAIGGFSVMKRMLGSAMFLPVAVAQLGLPLMTRAFSRSKKEFDNQLRLLIQSSLVIGLPLMIGFLFHSKQILTAVGLYPKFVFGPVTMVVGAPMVVLLYISMMLVNGIIASGNQKKMVSGTIKVTILIPLISAVCIFTSNLVLKNAAIGAVVSDLMTELMLIYVYAKVVRADIMTANLRRNLAISTGLCIPLALSGLLPMGWVWFMTTLLSLIGYVLVMYKAGLLHKRMLETEDLRINR